MKLKSSLDSQIYLREVEIFQDLTAAEVDALGERMPIEVVTAGSIFYSPEEPIEVLFLLKKGRVRLYHLSTEGKAFTTAILEPGTFFGEMALLGQVLYSSYAEAITPCMLCLMNRDDAKTLLLDDVRISFRIVEMLSKRLMETEHRLVDLALKRLSARVATQLLQLAHKQVDHAQRAGLPIIEPIAISCTHEELAQMVGAHRETTTRTLNELRGQNLIELHRGRIVLLNLDGLRHIETD